MFCIVDNSYTGVIIMVRFLQIIPCMKILCNIVMVSALNVTDWYIQQIVF
jgi:hypothetical protein